MNAGGRGEKDGGKKDMGEVGRFVMVKGDGRNGCLLERRYWLGGCIASGGERERGSKKQRKVQ